MQSCSREHSQQFSLSVSCQICLFSFVFSAREQLFLSILLIRGVQKWPWISPRGMLSTPYDSDSDWINNTVSADHTAHLETAETVNSRHQSLHHLHCCYSMNMNQATTSMQRVQYTNCWLEAALQLIKGKLPTRHVAWKQRLFLLFSRLLRYY